MEVQDRRHVQSACALKWRAEYSDHLTDCNVVVIPDEDPVDEKMGFSPGLRHAEEVCASVRPKAKSVRVLRLPGVGPKGDTSNWMDNEEQSGTSVDEMRKRLLAMVNAAPEWIPGDKILPLGPDGLPPPRPNAPTDPDALRKAGQAAADMGLVDPKEFERAAASLPPAQAEPAKQKWDGEITPGLQSVAEVLSGIRQSVAVKGLPQLLARLQIEVGSVASSTLDEKPDHKKLRDTLALIGAYALRGMEDLDKAGVP